MYKLKKFVKLIRNFLSNIMARTLRAWIFRNESCGPKSCRFEICGLDFCRPKFQTKTWV